MCELVVLCVSWWSCVCVGGPVCVLVVLCELLQFVNYA